MYSYINSTQLLRKITLIFLQEFSKGKKTKKKNSVRGRRHFRSCSIQSAGATARPDDFSFFPYPPVGNPAPRATSFPLNSMCLGCDTN